MNISTVNELIQSLESAGELSIKERKYLDIMRWAVGVAGERDAALNAERVWETAMMEVCGEDGPASVASEIRSLRALRDTAIQALKSQVEQLAAENAALKDINAWCKTDAFKNMYREFKTAEALGCSDADCMHDAMLVAIMHAPETPATDRIYAGIKADEVEEEPFGFVSRSGDLVVIELNGDRHIRDGMPVFVKALREGADKC